MNFLHEHAGRAAAGRQTKLFVAVRSEYRCARYSFLTRTPHNAEIIALTWPIEREVC